MRKIFPFLLLLATLLVLYWPQSEAQTHGGLRLTPRPYKELLMADDARSNYHQPDGLIVYCEDCKAPATPGAACAAGGKGAEAHRIRGGWVCF